ncbi:MAG: DNA repair protein [Phycisphaerae bacterium]|nr:DNA repair protein [Phycisphaerae bacterium]
MTSPTSARRRVERLIGLRQERQGQANETDRRSQEIATYLAVAEKVTDALELLSQRLFKELLGIVEAKTSIALQEILDQPIRLRADAEFKRGSATVEFWIDNEGNREDVYRGQGGSVANILSVGLRMFALTTLDPAKHRRFLVLDEQDCWLRPDLVPKLVKIVQEAGRALGFQVIMISHHDLAVFERFADKIYQFTPLLGGVVEVRQVMKPATVPDAIG